MFLFQYPLGWFFHFYVHGTVRRHIFTSVIGLLIQLYLFGHGIGHVFLMSTVAYILMQSFPRNVQQRYVMAWVLAYLSYTHASQMLYNWGGYQMTISTYTMLLVCKLSALSFSFKDGAQHPGDLTDDQVPRAVRELPSVLEMFSYTFYANACALGVFFEFADYKRFIERSGEYAKVPSPIASSIC